MIKQAPEEENIVKEEVKELDRIESPKVSKYSLDNIIFLFIRKINLQFINHTIIILRQS